MASRASRRGSSWSRSPRSRRQPCRQPCRCRRGTARVPCRCRAARHAWYGKWTVGLIVGFHGVLWYFNGISWDIWWLNLLSMGISGSNRWSYVSTICLAIFCGDIHLHRPYIGLIYGRYLHFRILKFSLKIWGFLTSGYHNSWMVYGESIYKWMIARGTPMT